MDKGVEETASITRRETIGLLASAAVFGALTVVGCGGGGGGGGAGFTGQTVAVPFSLPTGFALHSTDLNGVTLWSSQKLSGASFNGKQPSNSRPTIAFLRHATSGKYVMMGIAGAGKAGVGAMGSAVAMLALMLGVFALPATASRKLVEFIEADTATKTLAKAIESRLVVDPYCLFKADAKIDAALLVAINDLRGRNTPNAKPQDRDGGDSPLSITITPGDQSLARVIQIDTTAQIKVVNIGRRPMTAYVYKIGNADQNGTRVDLPKPVLVAGPQRIDATTGVVGAIVGITQNASLFGPVEGPAIELTVSSGSTKTFYETVVLMACGKDKAPDPDFYTLPRFASFVNEWKDERNQLDIHASLGGVLYEIVASVVGGAVGYASRAEALALLARIETFSAAARLAVYNAATAGEYGEVVKEIFTLAVEDTEDEVVLYMLAEYGSLVGAAGAIARITTTEAVAMRVLAFTVLRIFAVAGTLVALADVGFTFKDLTTTSTGEVWDETVVKPTVKISPTSANARAGGEVGFTATVVSAPAGSKYVYHWTLDGPNGGIISDRSTTPPKTGRLIDTTSNAVTMVSAPSDVEGWVYNVAVEAFLVSGNTKTSVGTATSKITINNSHYFITGVFAIIVEGRSCTPLVKWPKQGANAIYTLRGTGGNDPDYYGDHIEIRTTGSDYLHPGSIPSGEIWVALAGSNGDNPTADIPYYQNRFKGFTFQIEVANG